MPSTAEIATDCFSMRCVATFPLVTASFSLGLVGLLNSRLLNFFYREVSQEAGRVLAQVKPQRIRVLPIVQGTPETEAAVSKLVMQIVRAKAEDTNANTVKPEREIDQLVYRLYGLTADEVRLVEEAS